MKCKVCEGHGVRTVVTDTGIGWSRLCDGCDGTGKQIRELDPFDQAYLDGLAEIDRRHSRRIGYLVAVAIVSSVLVRTCTKENGQPWKRPAVTIFQNSTNHSQT